MLSSNSLHVLRFVYMYTRAPRVVVQNNSERPCAEEAKRVAVWLERLSCPHLGGPCGMIISVHLPYC